MMTPEKRFTFSGEVFKVSNFDFILNPFEQVIENPKRFKMRCIVGIIIQ